MKKLKLYIKKKYIYIFFLPEGFISKQKKKKERNGKFQMILISTEIKIEYRILFHPMDLFSNNCSFHLYWINLSSLNYKICKIRSNVRFAIRVCIYHQKKKEEKRNIYK